MQCFVYRCCVLYGLFYFVLVGSYLSNTSQNVLPALQCDTKAFIPKSTFVIRYFSEVMSSICSIIFLDMRLALNEREAHIIMDTIICEQDGMNNGTPT